MQAVSFVITQFITDTSAVQRVLNALQRTRLSRGLVTQPLPHLPSASCLSFSVFLCVAESSLLAGEVVRAYGVGEEPNNTTAAKPGLLYITQYSLLSCNSLVEIGLKIISI